MTKMETGANKDEPTEQTWQALLDLCSDLKNLAIKSPALRIELAYRLEAIAKYHREIAKQDGA